MSPLKHTPSTTPISSAHVASPRDARRPSRRRAVAGALSAGVLIGATLCTGAVPASAATAVSVKGGVLHVISETGKENHIEVNVHTVSADEKYYQISDLGDTLTAGSGCTQDGVAVGCRITADLTLIRVETKDLKDTIMSGVDVFTPMGVHAGSGDDTISGGDGTDLLTGGTGSDTIRGGTGSDTIHGGPGSDFLNGGGGSDTIRGGAGSDSLRGGAGSDTIYGDAGADKIRGERGHDTLSGGAGNDVLKGDGEKAKGKPPKRKGGNDTLFGGSGDDELFGNRGKDTLDGGRGSDTLSGGAGTDHLKGGRGKDHLDAQDNRAENVDGGSDEDTCKVDTIDTTMNCEA
jgi:Ca2+-binding RTX toxin-like protein